MNHLIEELSEIVRIHLPKEYTSVSYAISQHGKILAADAIGTNGHKEEASSTTEDTYNIASVSKIICTLAVMKLAEEKKVDLDEPVITYLPRFHMPDGRYQKITLRQCLNHSSGLPGTMWRGFSASQVGEYDYYEDVYSYMEHNYLKAQPGEFSVYCNDGFTLAEMVVAEISKQPFSQFAYESIIKPIGAKSIQTSEQLKDESRLTRQKKRTFEKLYIQGGAGYTASMKDLCKLGELILHPQGIFSQESIDEMGKSQGVSFLENDGSKGYGLGWDNVSFTHADYDLGEGVLQKSGSSFQFATQFFVIPKYDAVLAISATNDCKLDIKNLIFKLFEVAMEDKNMIVYKKQYCPVQPAVKEKFSGYYLVSSTIFYAHIHGGELLVRNETTRGETEIVYQDFRYNGKTFQGLEEKELYFAEYGTECYLMGNFRGQVLPIAQKAKDYPRLQEVWKQRIGKKYICINTTPSDIVISELMAGFTVKQVEGIQGVIFASFSTHKDGETGSEFEAPVIPVNENLAASYLNTPSNPGRDSIFLVYKKEEDGREFCHTASYLYQDAADAESYRNQGFEEKGKYNKVYVIQQELETLPEIPEGRRLLVLNEQMDVIYDSISEEEYTSVKEGYLIFI